jgi:hypothetical protein
MSETEKPRKKRGKGVSQDDLEMKYPSLKTLAAPGEASKRSWVATFNTRPDAMHNLLADYIKQVHAKPGRIGQRPMPKEEEVDFHALVYGEENDLPLTEVLPKLMNGRSQNSLAPKVGMSRTNFQRLMNGTYDPHVDELRLIAAAVGKPPSYFVEYRKAMAIAAFVNLVNERPGIATKLYRQYLTVRMGEI